MEWTGHNFLSFWIVFCPFTNLKNLKNQFWKNGKNIILYSCNINDNHMMYDFWDTEQTGCFVILDHFLCFYPLTPSNSLRKKRKKCLEISFYTSVSKIMIICYTVPEIWHVTDVIIFHFGLFFALLPP